MNAKRNVNLMVSPCEPATLLFSSLEGVDALEDVTKYRDDDDDKDIGDGRRYHVKNMVLVEELDEAIGDADKQDSSDTITKKLDTAVQVRLGEHDVARQDETNREADTKSKYIGCHTRSDVDMICYVEVGLVKDKV